MHRRSDKPRSGRHAFTLFELMLVLGLLVLVGVIAWPSIQHAYEGIRLKATADQVVAAFGHARVQAMSTGVTQVFRFQPGTGQYTLMTMPDDSQGVDSDASGAMSAMAGANPQSASSPDSSASSSPSGAASTPTDPNANPNPASPDGTSAGAATTCSTYQLNDGFVFAKGDRVLDNRAALAESALPTDDASGGSSSDAAPPVLFYPDGTTSEAMVTISDKTGRSISVSLRGLTGIARQGDVFAGEAPQ